MLIDSINIEGGKSQIDINKLNLNMDCKVDKLIKINLIDFVILLFYKRKSILVPRKYVLKYLKVGNRTSIQMVRKEL